jgi:hypothetical protein
MVSETMVQRQKRLAAAYDERQRREGEPLDVVLWLILMILALGASWALVHNIGGLMP